MGFSWFFVAVEIFPFVKLRSEDGFGFEGGKVRGLIIRGLLSFFSLSARPGKNLNKKKRKGRKGASLRGAEGDARRCSRQKTHMY